MSYLIPLTDNQLTSRFVEGVLGIEKRSEISLAVREIVKAELQLATVENKTTIKSESYRDISYVNDAARDGLREQIFKELVTLKRLDKDDEIILGEGGALPNSDLKNERQAIIITGLPASGKSTIASKIADAYGAMMLDSDFAKRKFPEFQNDFGATLVHEESSIIIFGDENHNFNFSVKEYCIAQGINIVIPRIGHNMVSILDFATYLKENKYSVHLILVSLDRVDSTKRAFERYIETKRYVPLSLIFDMYANDPILTYYRVKNNEIFSSFGKVSTKNRPPEIIEYSNSCPLVNITL